MPDEEGTRHDAELERSRRRLEAIFDSPDSFIGVLEPDGTLLEANETALEFLDATPADVEGEPFWETGWWTHSEDLQHRLREWIERAATGEHVRFEATHRSPDGGEITVDGVIRPVTEASGEVTSLIAEGRNITERKRYEERLKAIDEATHRLLTANTRAEVGEIIVDVADDALEQPLTAMWIYDATSDRLEPIAAADAAADLDNTRAAADEIGAIPAGTTEMQVFHGGETTIIEDYRTVDAPAHPETPIRTLLLAPLGVYGQLHVGSRTVERFDETTLELLEILARNATGALERVERERTLSRLHDVTRELMRLTSTDEVASLAVAAGRDVLGLPLAFLYELTDDGRTLMPMTVSDELNDRVGDLPRFETDEGVFREVLEAGDVRFYDDVRTGTDTGCPLPFGGVIVAPLGDHGVLGSASLEPAEFDTFDRELASILAAETEAALDTVEREQTLRIRERELERQNERLEEFTAVVAHDLRNPLNVATARLPMAREECDSEHLDPAMDALERMEALIEDTLTLARQGRTLDEPKPVRLARVVEDAWRTTGPSGATLDLDDDLGTVTGDGDRLQELLENLFRNAVEHGSDDVTVTVGRIDGGFYVADDGPGVPDEERNVVFTRGYTTGGAGTGLGLAIVERIVDAHGWDVAVTESTDGGARFEITGLDR